MNRKKWISIALVAAMTAAGATTVMAEDSVGPAGSGSVTGPGAEPVPIAETQNTQTVPVQKGWFVYNNAWYYGATADTLQTGWLLEGKTWYYLDQNGVMQTGWINVNGQKYFMGSNGAMMTGWIELNGTWYFLNRDHGAMVSNGWVFEGNTWYYFDENGVMATGWITSNGQKYYLKNSGSMATHWNLIDGVWYYFHANGAMASGWNWVGSCWYYLNEEGQMQTGIVNVDGRNYYLDASGAMRGSNWFQLGSIWYFAEPNGALKSGWAFLNGSWYYFNANSEMMTGWQQVDGSWYYLNASGAMHTGWLQLGPTWYYLEANGMMAVGNRTINGVNYTFESSGAMKETADENTSNGGTENGTATPSNYSWQFRNGAWYYLASDGTPATNWQKIGGIWYYLNSSGAMHTGWLQLGNSWYYLDASGAMKTGWYQVGSSWYYSNTAGVMITGWIYDNGLFYAQPGGAMVTGNYTTPDGIARTFDASGRMVGTIEGIDVSAHQKEIDWNAVKASGKVSFAMLRTGFGKEDIANQEDKYFVQNFNGARAAGIPVGVYHFSYAVNTQEALQEAELCLQILSKAGATPNTLSMPVTFDVEHAGTTGKLPSDQITAIVQTFCDRIRQAGYDVMVYANKTWFTDKMNFDTVNANNTIWLAQYNTYTTFDKMESVDMWQYTSSGSVPGITGRVDMNVLLNPNVLKNR